MLELISEFRVQRICCRDGGTPSETTVEQSAIIPGMSDTSITVLHRLITLSQRTGINCASLTSLGAGASSLMFLTTRVSSRFSSFRGAKDTNPRHLTASYRISVILRVCILLAAFHIPDVLLIMVFTILKKVRGGAWIGEI